MATVILENPHWQIEIAPDLGASVVNGRIRLHGAWRPLLRETPPEAVEAGNVSRLASFLLAPYSNRLPHARFTFQGREHQLRPNTPDGNVQHGDVRRRPWRMITHTVTQLSLALDTRAFADFNFPFPFTASVLYRLVGPAFLARFEMTNAGNTPMPAGFGFHPYFSRTLDGADEAPEFQARVTGVYAGLIPTAAAGPVPAEHDFARRRPLGTLALNDCRAGWDGQAELRWPRAGVRLALSATPPLRHLVVFAPPGEPFFAIEPVTNASNGFNLLAAGVPGHGVLVLAPGESVSGEMALTLTEAPS